MSHKGPPETFLGRDAKTWGKNIGWVPVTPICPSPDLCPPYTDIGAAAIAEEAENVKIHMLIASYRDKLCPRTLHNAFSKAVNPSRLFVRIIEQRDFESEELDDAPCWDEYCNRYNKDCETFRKNVRIVSVSSATAKGPTDPRSKLSSMILYDFLHPDDPDFEPVQLNDFCLQTDSHMDFDIGFDSSLVYMFHRAKNDYAVLSTYVSDIKENDTHPVEVPLLCMVEFTNSIRNWGTKLCRNLEAPKLTTQWGAGLSFHRVHAEINVPVDPYLDDVFNGEEGSRAVRFFTHGYDIYSPDQVFVTHDYHGHQSNPVVHTWGRGKRKALFGASEEDPAPAPAPPMKFMEEIERIRDSVKIAGTRRVNLLMGIEDGDDETQQKIRKSRFGLGTKRTLEQVEEFMGVSFKERKMLVNKCGSLLWVAWNHDQQDYGIRQTLMRPLYDEKPSPVSLPDQKYRAQITLLDKNLPGMPLMPQSETFRSNGNIVFVGFAFVIIVLASTRIFRRKKDGRYKN